MERQTERWREQQKVTKTDPEKDQGDEALWGTELTGGTNIEILSKKNHLFFISTEFRRRGFGVQSV